MRSFLRRAGSGDRIQIMIKMPRIRTYGIARLAVVVTIATCLFAPERALADSVIDAATKPYFVLGGLVRWIGLWK
ncbi:hypothetical protein [Bradyrhizobium sp.]|uniref:hypothetical protein n=1 Tax=Bradyrhizobium sp. TaxID=376 RepID=UPI003C75E081